jgi:YihY family inner membrane protein
MLKELFTTPTAQLGRASRFMVFIVKLCIHCARLLKKNRAGQQAAALSYHTVFGLVPLAIVMLLIFQALPAYSDIAEKIKDFVYDQANFSAFESASSDAEDSQQTVALTEHLDKLVAKFFDATRHKGGIKYFSVILVIWAASCLLSTIEKAFNNIWHVGRGRNFLHRIINYWALLTLGPLVIGAGIYAGTEYFDWSGMPLAHGILLDIAEVLWSFVVAMVVLFLLYFVLPNTKVKAGAAIWGAAVAALVWVAVKNIYGVCVTEMKLYSTLYGVMALIPMTVMWIYITWLIVLFGLQLAFTTQHLKTLDAGEITAAQKRKDHFIANDMTAINIVREIAAAFESNEAPLSGEVISSKLDIPAEFADKILSHLVEAELVVKTSDPKIGFAPAKDPASIKLSDIAAVVANMGFAQSPIDQPAHLKQIARSQQNALAQYNVKQILGEPQRDS